MIESRDTEFNGIIFRSWLEARWAKFFHHLEVRYAYEAQRFDFGDIVYSPDFFLEDYDIWIEIKPLYFWLGDTDVRLIVEKAKRLSAEVKKPVYICAGIPEPDPEGKIGGGYVFVMEPLCYRQMRFSEAARELEQYFGASLEKRILSAAAQAKTLPIVSFKSVSGVLNRWLSRTK